MSLLEFVFWASASIVVYIYCGYLITIIFLTRIYTRKIMKGPFEPTVSILITAYNEEKHIYKTIENKLSLQYPKEKLEIIVLSDASTDRTDNIVSEFSSKGIKFFRQNKREGKTAALNVGATNASGEIIVFSDANSIYEPDALRYLLENFHDPMVGYVTGKMIYTSQHDSSTEDGCSKYMQYENVLRSYETQIGSIVAVDGGIDAVRKSLYESMRADQIPDFVLPLKVIEKGYRVVYEPKAILREPALASSRNEFKMRARVTLRALWALKDMKHLFNFAYYGIFSWQLFSHKVLRYNAFLFLAALLVVSGLLSQEKPLYLWVFLTQAVFYLIACSGYILEKSELKWKGVNIPYYFTLINIAAGHACWKFLRGEKIVTWQPRVGEWDSVEASSQEQSGRSVVEVG
jgi:cellulose synthase/poly-beta-1,6-N-acetylglucosamine synthase-like glycosyltransferase